MSAGEQLDKLGALIAEFERSDLRVVHIRRGDIEIHLSKDPVEQSRVARDPSPAPHAAARPPAAARGELASSTTPATAIAVPEGAVVIRAPNIGTFYRSPKPGSPPYVVIGQKVEAGEEICLIEVMKLFTALRCEVTGTILAILVEDGTMVEADQPLFAIEDA